MRRGTNQSFSRSRLVSIFPIVVYESSCSPVFISSTIFSRQPEATSQGSGERQTKTSSSNESPSRSGRGATAGSRHRRPSSRASTLSSREYRNKQKRQNSEEQTDLNKAQETNPIDEGFVKRVPSTPQPSTGRLRGRQRGSYRKRARGNTATSQAFAPESQLTVQASEIIQASGLARLSPTAQANITLSRNRRVEWESRKHAGFKW
ncbi:hypothetical protein BJ170DRAFT_412420 [Xylariales sp. AK1849]|nr:hypothetical protein BJ170DRAFT_412420 [Xylariales sp. AK1849]